MVVYFWLILIIGLYGFILQANKNQRRKKCFVIVSFALIILLAGLRSSNIGIDLKAHYARNFIKIASYDWSQLASFTTPYEMLYKALFVDKSCGYYNVGTGVGTSLLDQIKGMVEIFGENGRKSEIIMRPDKPNAPQYIMDITPAVKDLGYEPKYNYLEMLRDFKQEMLLAESI